MPRTRPHLLALTLLGWLAAGSAVAPLVRAPRLVPWMLTWVAACAALAAGAVAIALGARRLPALDGGRRAVTAALGAPLAFALAAWSGGPASPAVVVLALALLAGRWQRRAAAAWVVAGLALVLLAVVHRLSGHAVTLPLLVQGGAVLVGVAVIPVWLGARAGASVSAAVRRSEQLERFFTTARPTPEHPSVRPASLRHDAVLTREQQAERREFEILSAYLDDLAELHGATEAVYWRLDPRREVLVAAAWAHGGPDEPPVLHPDMAFLVDWAAREGLVQCDAHEPRPRSAAAPVLRGPAIAGALSMWAHEGIKGTRERVRLWLPRHAAHLARLIELLESSRDEARRSVQSHAILKAAHAFQEAPSPEAVAAAICETALQVTSGTRALLVRWDAESGRGYVESSVGAAAPAPGTAIDPASLTARMCREGMPRVWEDARMAVAAERVVGHADHGRTIGSFGIYPLKKEGLEVIGAIVVEAEMPETVLIKDVRNVKLLAGYAVVALEAAWALDEATRTARTDQLTGLWNRRYFDEQLERVHREYNRHQHPCALIVSDIDFFKKVNDTYGHDAGDAVLRSVAAIFQENVRTTDYCARFGGEEIAVLLPETTLAGAAELAERLRRAVEGRVVRFQTKEIRVTASLGVAAFPESASSWDGFFAAADKALYQAKHGGRNQVRCAEPKPVRSRA